MDFDYLIVSGFSAISIDRRLVAPWLNHTNVAAFNYLLRLEIFVSENRQLWAVHLILDFDPISKIFQEVGHAIRSGDPWINRINVSKLDFLARDDLPPVRLPVHQIPPQLAIPLQQVPLEAKAAVERIASSSRLSLKEDIDRFCFAKEERTPERPVEISDTKTEFDRFSTAHQPE